MIRAAVPADVPGLANLDELADSWPWPAVQIAGACDGQSGQDVLLLEQDKALAAFVVMACAVDEGSIHRIAVHPQYRCRGLGGRLLDAALLALREQNVSRVLLELRKSNSAAFSLYCSRGFVVDGQRKGYYPGHPHREDALLMSLAW